MVATEREGWILVAEDDPYVRKTLNFILSVRWHVELAPDGAAAWTALKQRTPDLVLSDVVMPSVDGLSLVRRIRADPALQEVPVILLSGRAGEQETIRGLEAGADDYLVKPFSTRELIVRVQTRLEITAMRRRAARQAEALAGLERQRRWTERLLDSLPVPLLLLEPGSARLLFANGAAQRLTLHPIPPGTNLADVGLRRAAGDAPLRAEELAAPRSDGNLRGVAVHLNHGAAATALLADSEFLVAGEGHDATTVLALRDVTTLMRTEAELRGALRVRDEFLSVASHELRTPLTTLALQAGSLHAALVRAPATSEAGPDRDRVGAKLATMKDQIFRLDRLVDRLLDVSRLIEGRLELQPEDVDLGEAARDAVEALRDQADRSGSSLDLRAPTGVVGHWDRLRLDQVLTNLLSNAIKFGRGKPIEMAVEVPAASEARITVRDHGVGIEAAQVERIFERFGRASGERHYPGLGLGLWISRQIVEASGGRISVHSRPDEGSTFTVELPVRAPVRPEAR
jgi:signal transduction histidine kinase